MSAFRPDGIPSTKGLRRQPAGPRLRIAGTLDGRLPGLAVAAKDLFGVAGQVSVCGCPNWSSTHVLAVNPAGATDSLLETVNAARRPEIDADHDRCASSR